MSLKAETGETDLIAALFKFEWNFIVAQELFHMCTYLFSKEPSHKTNRNPIKKDPKAVSDQFPV